MVETNCCDIISEDVEDAIVLEGSPGPGLIGNIVGWQIVQDLKMKEIGYIESPKFPPLAVLYNGLTINPFRVYEGEGIVMFLSDFIVPSDIVYEMTNSIINWMVKNNSKEIITFNSMVVRERFNNVTAVANSKEVLQKLADKEIPTLPAGNIAGLSGTLLTKSAPKGIPGTCILAETLNPYPDPRVASEVVETLNKIIGTDIDPQPLMKEAEHIESRLKKLAEQMNQQPDNTIYG